MTIEQFELSLDAMKREAELHDAWWRGAAASLRRDDGMARAAAHAEADAPGWIEKAVAFVHRHATMHQTFMTEDVRAEADSWPRLKVDEPRAWGPVLQLAARRRYIEKAGYAPAASSNRSPKVQWRSLVYRAQPLDLSV